MSAFKWLAFTLGVGLVAVYGSIWLEVMNPMLAATDGQAQTQAAQDGLGWLQSFVELLPVVMLGLLVFALLVGVVVRRQAVGGGI